ncbi:hypothetical protein RJT34_25040 [Clitoria ternatea]|uniref:Uncharacterized protein n=1 Tax=Clitoria ternatea TaxID=43366 RepID=A0AAN9FXC6_CLITE
MERYYYWYNYGEQLPPRPSAVTVQQSYYEVGGNRDTYTNMEQMVMDHVGPSTGCMLEHDDQTGNEDDDVEEDPNLEVKRFYDWLVAAKTPLWDGCQSHTELSVSLAALSLKANYNLLGGCFNRMVESMV